MNKLWSILVIGLLVTSAGLFIYTFVWWQSAMQSLDREFAIHRSAAQACAAGKGVDDKDQFTKRLTKTGDFKPAEGARVKPNLRAFESRVLETWDQTLVTRIDAEFGPSGRLEACWMRGSNSYHGL